MVYRGFFKRIFDLVLSFIALIVFFPLFLALSFMVKVKLGSPVFFTQKRPGLNERIFTMNKFRTMTNEKDDNGELLPDNKRLTGFGKFLRSTSLDELPEFINVIRGDMSIVGPRPQLVKDMVFMTDEQKKRHSVLPGITGWAQVNGRNNISWEEKLSLDLQYVKDISFLKDCKIILMTLAKVFKRDDVVTKGMDTAEDFGDYLLRTGKIDKGEYDEKIKFSKKLLEKNL